MVRIQLANSLLPEDLNVPAGDEWRSSLLGWLLLRVRQGVEIGRAHV